MPNKRIGPRKMDAAEGSVAVNAPVAAVYKGWLLFEDYPKFITVIKHVRKLDANHFVASLGFNGNNTTPPPSLPSLGNFRPLL